jgi:hypothetical protein
MSNQKPIQPTDGPPIKPDDSFTKESIIPKKPGGKYFNSHYLKTL